VILGHDGTVDPPDGPSLDEQRVRDLVAQDAPIDGFGVGTRMNTSGDAPFLDCAYKLVEYEGRPRRKRSEGKATWPGRKQVYRQTTPDGRATGDVLALEGDPVPGLSLLQPVMRNGTRVAALPTLRQCRAHAREAIASLPTPLCGLEDAEPYPVTIAPALRALAAALDRGR
jgi:nicotinate phosphoribosyltransferase